MTDKIVNLFINNHGTFSRTLQFEVIVIIVIVMIFLTQTFPKTYGFVILLLLFSFYIANIYTGVQQETLEDINQTTMNKLNSIQNTIDTIVTTKIKRFNNHMGNKRLVNQKQIIDKVYENNQMTSLYIDSNMINFIYSILVLSKYNDYEFYTFVKGVNNILQIRKEIEEFYDANKKYPQNTSEMFEKAIELKTNTINNLHNFIYSVPKSNQMYQYVNNIVARYNILITRNLEKINQMYKRHNISINNSTKFIYMPHTKIPGQPFDKMLDTGLMSFFRT